MVKNEIKIFENTEFGKVRTAVNETGEPLFCLLDVARCLGYARPADAVTTHCKGVSILPTPTESGIQNIKFGKESEVYRLVMKSKTPNAEKFQDWVCEEVLPSIRKTGQYQVSQFSIPKTLSEALQLAANIEKEREQLALQNAEMKPKVDSYDKFLAIDDSMTMTTCAKKFFISAQKLNNILVVEKVIYKKGNNYYPRAKYQDKGYFKVKDITFNDGTNLTSQLRLTPKGQEFVKNILFSYGFKEQKDLFEE